MRLSEPLELARSNFTFWLSFLINKTPMSYDNEVYSWSVFKKIK